MRLFLTVLLAVLCSTGLLASVMTGPEAEPAVVAHFMNTGFRPESYRAIDTIVLHSSYNSVGPDKYSVAGVLALYHRYGVSSHYLIDRDGTIYQLVPDRYLSYHAGISRMPDGRTSVNRFSIGIEVLNCRDGTYTDAQYASLRWLIRREKSRYPIEHIVGHGQIAPERRSDPWNFNWETIRDL